MFFMELLPKDVSNPNHGVMLFNGIMHLNSYNLNIKV